MQKPWHMLNNQLPNYIRACRMIQQSQACMNWSNHKNVHCMGLHYTQRYNFASWTNHMLIS